MTLTRKRRSTAYLLTSLVLLIALMAAVSTASAERPLDLSAPIAVVNGVEVPYSLFFSILESRVGAETLQNLVLYEIVKHAAEDHGIYVGDDAVDDELTAFIFYNFESEESFINQIQTHRMTIAEVRTQIWMDLAMREIAKGEVELTEEEIREFFEENKEHLYDKELRVEARQILTSSRESADVIMEDLLDGADFGALAREKSLDRGTRDRGGYIGLFPQGLMFPELDSAIFQAGTGDIVGPVESPDGWHIVEILDRLLPTDAVFEEIRDQVESDMKEWLSRDTDAILLDLVAEADVEITDVKYRSLQELLDTIKAQRHLMGENTTSEMGLPIE